MEEKGENRTEEEQIDDEMITSIEPVIHRRERKARKTNENYSITDYKGIDSTTLFARYEFRLMKKVKMG